MRIGGLGIDPILGRSGSESMACYEGLCCKLGISWPFSMMRVFLNKCKNKKRLMRAKKSASSYYRRCE